MFTVLTFGHDIIEIELTEFRAVALRKNRAKALNLCGSRSAEDALAFCVQPIDESQLALFFEGYLVNRKALLNRLAPVWQREALSDAALMLQAWRQWGQDSLAHLQGSFVFALCDYNDPQKPQIILYREPLGRRSLYYFASSKCFLVASEPATLLAHPAVSSQPDEAWLDRHFALSRPSDNRTPFRDIRKLLPGECLICTPGTITRHREPLTLGRQKLQYSRDTDYAEHFRELLDQAVARCLTDAGEKVGIMLSGGMDSGPLAALAQRRLQAEGRTLTAYSWSLPHYPNADESTAITDCAQHVGCGLKLLPASAELPMRDLSHWPVNPNSPTANCFRRLKFTVYRAAAADGCRVILNGASGDNLYPYPSDTLLENWLSGRYGTLLAGIARIARHGGLWGVWRNPAVRRLGKHWLGWPDQAPAPPIWLSADARQRWQATNSPWPAESSAHPRPDHYQSALGQWAADGVSEEVFFTRRCGIERRDPFHDAELIDFMLSVPSDQCYRNGHTKWLARQAMEGLLPETIRWRPRGGLLTEFFDAGYRREHTALRKLLLAPDVAWPAYVDHDWIMRALDANEPSEKEKLLVWYCAAFELWCQALSGDHPELLQFAYSAV